MQYVLFNLIRTRKQIFSSLKPCLEYYGFCYLLFFSLNYNTNNTVSVLEFFIYLADHARHFFYPLLNMLMFISTMSQIFSWLSLNILCELGCETYKLELKRTKQFPIETSHNMLMSNKFRLNSKVQHTRYILQLYSEFTDFQGSKMFEAQPRIFYPCVTFHISRVTCIFFFFIFFFTNW